MRAPSVHARVGGPHVNDQIAGLAFGSAFG